MKTQLSRCSAVVLLLLATLALALGALPTRAASVTVVNTNDSGAGSLRQAIANANSGDTINFNLTYPATITLTSGEIMIDKNLTIDGPGASNLAISGNNASRVFHIIDPDVNATIIGVKITKGKAEFGGGVATIGILTVANSTFFSNDGGSKSGGGIAVTGGKLTVINSSFSTNIAGWNGGGLYSTNGTVIVTSSIFTGNSATSNGGGIAHLVGPMTISNSTFSGNSAQIEGGGIYTNDTLTVTNSTLYNNHAGTIFPSQGDGGAIWHGYYALKIINSTFVANSAKHSGGSIFTIEAPTVMNTIVANSTSGGMCQGTFHSASTNNLATDATCSPGFTQVTFPQLAPGALNGSPAYFPLNPGSVAIDTGTNTGCPATDQRGVSRPQDGDGNGTVLCDIGSYEAIFGERGGKLYLPLIMK